MSIHNRSDKNDDNTICLMTRRLYLPVVILENNIIKHIVGVGIVAHLPAIKKMAQWDEIVACVVTMFMKVFGQQQFQNRLIA